jgi:hypothetical protein
MILSVVDPYNYDATIERGRPQENHESGKTAGFGQQFPIDPLQFTPTRAQFRANGRNCAFSTDEGIRGFADCEMRIANEEHKRREKSSIGMSGNSAAQFDA